MRGVASSGQPPPHAVLVVDGEPLLREAVGHWLKQSGDFTLCGEAEEAAQALECVERRRPALVVTELALPGRSGLELIKDLRAHHPEVRVLVFTRCDERLYAGRALRAGARGFLSKRARGEELLAALRQVMAGRIALAADLALRLLEEFTGVNDAGVGGLGRLTDRELEVLRWLGQARTVREIATLLHLSPKTVETHRVNIMRKLRIPSSPELLRFALQLTEGELGAGLAAAVSGPDAAVPRPGRGAQPQGS
ncbi:MAG: response regulator transcription factor [Limisphaera sp.]|nr:response regulator transcription factor [Limisphaera sp.]